jgi:hypothetical protein
MALNGRQRPIQPISFKLRIDRQTALRLQPRG